MKGKTVIRQKEQYIWYE